MDAEKLILLERAAADLMVKWASMKLYMIHCTFSGNDIRNLNKHCPMYYSISH